METIKVNMNPNPLDVQTIHASQNDGEARQWGFELHNNGDVIDSSEVTDQLVFKAYKGGTEQLLPENGSVPTTSPIIADIKYPQGELADQEFLYRESPTEEDGLAKLTRIKGNTLAFNQLVPTNWASSGSGSGVTFTNNNDGSYTFNGTSTGVTFIPRSVVVSAKANHKYLVNVGNDSNTGLIITINGLAEGSYVKTKGIISSPTDNNFVLFYQSGASFNNLKVWPQITDLTQMFGAGKEPTVEQFKALFHLPYYSYQSTLLPFKGTGIKTVGKNLLKPYPYETTANGITIKYADNSCTITGTCTLNIAIPITTEVSAYRTTLLSGTYHVYVSSNKVDHQVIDLGASRIIQDSTFTLTQQTDILFRLGFKNGTTYDDTIYFQITKEQSNVFEPYTSSTLSLPISTYFPTGMKSAGSVYDELTPTKAITRIGAVDLGSVTWAYNSTDARFYANIDGVKPSPTSGTAFSSGMLTVPYQTIFTDTPVSFGNMLAYIADKDMLIWQYTTGTGTANVNIKDTRYTDAAAFKTAMSGVYLYYELKTPTETSFTTASLITENAEIPLSNNDGVLIGKCTEELSAEPGFHDAKIKLADADGECYSNKIQLHVERSPQ